MIFSHLLSLLSCACRAGLPRIHYLGAHDDKGCLDVTVFSVQHEKRKIHIQTFLFDSMSIKWRLYHCRITKQTLN